MKQFNKGFLATMFLALMVVTSGCSSSKKRSMSDADYEGMSSDLQDKKLADYNLTVGSSSDDEATGPLQTVFFPFDSSRLSQGEKNKLKLSAEFLKKFGAVRIEIEGHCDERGGVEYNIALGHRRAKAVKQYLMALGVRAKQMSTVSFGKERPKAYGHDEDAWAQNRRGNFVITKL